MYARNLNKTNKLPTGQKEPRKFDFSLLGEDVAASIRENFRANIGRIFDTLRDTQGVTQTRLAEKMGVPLSLLSQMRSGKYFPSVDQMQRLLNVLNEYMDVQPEDLIKNPHKKAAEDLLVELARRAGYTLVKKP